MKTFGLILFKNSDEYINKIDAEDITEAIEKFAAIKQLSAEDLLKIFAIVEVPQKIYHNA